MSVLYCSLLLCACSGTVCIPHLLHIHQHSRSFCGLCQALHKRLFFFFAIVLFGLGLLEPEGEHVFCFMVRWFFPMHIPHVEKEGEQPCAAFTVVFLTRPIYMELSGLTCSL